MADTYIPRLRPNTFMVLLLRATRSEFGNSPAWGRSSNGLVRTKLFTDLMKVADPSYSPAVEETLSSYMSKFMDGSRPYSPTYIPFKTAAFQSAVSLRMEEGYMDALKAMNQLCVTYLNMENETCLRLLLGGIIETILQDDSFAGTLTFQGYQMDKTKLASLTEVPLQAFLLDVWRLIVTENHNSAEAAETYADWVGNDGRSGFPPTIVTTIGTEMAKKITVSTVLHEESTANTVIEDGTHGMDGNSQHEEEPTILEADQQQENDGSKQQTLNHSGNLFIQHAEKITNIGYVENLTI